MFICYEVSLELIRNLRDLVPIIQRFDRDLADQMHRAATSVTLNLGEGQRLRGGNQRRHYEIAHGSANEVKASLDVAEAWGWVCDTEAPRRILDRQLALLWRLTHGRMIKTHYGKPVRERGDRGEPGERGGRGERGERGALDGSVGQAPEQTEQPIERGAS